MSSDPLASFGRPDWVTGRIRQHRAAVPALYVAFGSLGTLALLAVVLTGGASLVDVHGPAGVLGLALGLLVATLLGPLPLVAGLRRLIPLLRFGRSELVLAAPAKVGQVLEARLELPTSLGGVERVTARLSCNGVRRRALFFSGMRTTHGSFDAPHWAATQELSPGVAGPIALRFELPAGLPVTDVADDEPTSGTFWRLEVVASRPGLDYRTRFTLPVLTAAA